MKLNGKQCFDSAMIMTFEDNNLYCEYARYAFYFMQDNEYYEAHNCTPGVLVHRGTGVGEGKYLFWLENNEVFPILNINGAYDVIDYEDDIKYYVDEETKTIIDKCMNFLNQDIYHGGVIESDGI